VSRVELSSEASELRYASWGVKVGVFVSVQINVSKLLCFLDCLVSILGWSQIHNHVKMNLLEEGTQHEQWSSLLVKRSLKLGHVSTSIRPSATALPGTRVSGAL
jgi:hypothetical protein